MHRLGDPNMRLVATLATETEVSGALEEAGGIAEVLINAAEKFLAKVPK